MSRAAAVDRAQRVYCVRDHGREHADQVPGGNGGMRHGVGVQAEDPDVAAVRGVQADRKPPGSRPVPGTLPSRYL